MRRSADEIIADVRAMVAAADTPAARVARLTARAAADEIAELAATVAADEIAQVAARVAADELTAPFKMSVCLRCPCYRCRRIPMAPGCGGSRCRCDRCRIPMTPEPVSSDEPADAVDPEPAEAKAEAPETDVDGFELRCILAADAPPTAAASAIAISSVISSSSRRSNSCSRSNNNSRSVSQPRHILEQNSSSRDISRSGTSTASDVVGAASSFEPFHPRRRQRSKQFGSVFDSIEDKRASLQREDAATAATAATDQSSATDYLMTMASASAVASAYATRQQVQRRPASEDIGSQQKRRKRSEQ